MDIFTEAGADDPKSDDSKDLLVVYRALVEAKRAGEKLLEEGKPFDKVRYHKLEIKADALWLKLNQKESFYCCQELIKSGHMDPMVAEMLTSFGGKVDPSKPAEPCLRFKL